MVLSTNIVSTEEQANYVLLGVSACALILAFLWPVFMGNSYTPTQADKTQLLEPGAPGMIRYHVIYH